MKPITMGASEMFAPKFMGFAQNIREKTDLGFLKLSVTDA